MAVKFKSALLWLHIKACLKFYYADLLNVIRSIIDCYCKKRNKQTNKKRIDFVDDSGRNVRKVFYEYEFYS